jgi:hypothetical protein
MEKEAIALRDRKEIPRCGATSRQTGEPCKLEAGKGTDHFGVGNCKFHGGRQQSVNSKSFKHGLNSKIQYPILIDKAKQLREDRDVFDLRDHIFLMEAIAQEILEHAENVEDLYPLVKVIETTTKTIERLHNIEVGRRYVISVETMSGIIGKVVNVIERHVPDPYLRALISEDILKINQTRLPLPVIDGISIEESSAD